MKEAEQANLEVLNMSLPTRQDHQDQSFHNSRNSKSKASDAATLPSVIVSNATQKHNSMRPTLKDANYNLTRAFQNSHILPDAS